MTKEELNVVKKDVTLARVVDTSFAEGAAALGPYRK